MSIGFSQTAPTPNAMPVTATGITYVMPVAVTIRIFALRASLVKLDKVDKGFLFLRVEQNIQLKCRNAHASNGGLSKELRVYNVNCIRSYASTL